MCVCMNLSVYAVLWTKMKLLWVLSRCGQRTRRAFVCNRHKHAKEHGRFGRKQWEIFLWRRDSYVCEKGRLARKSWETLPGISTTLAIPSQIDEREARGLPTVTIPSHSPCHPTTLHLRNVWLRNLCTCLWGTIKAGSTCPFPSSSCTVIPS